MKEANTTLRLVFLSVLALALLGFLGFGFYRLWMENQETARLTNLFEEAGKKEAANQRALQIRESALAEVTAFEAIALASQNLVPTIESIEDAGRSLGLTTKIASVEEGEAGSSNQAVKIVVESSGSWRGNFTLLKALESLPQRIKIESASLSKSESSWRSRIELTLLSLD